MDHRGPGNAVELATHQREGVARMLLEHMVLDRVARFVEHDAVDSVGHQRVQVRRGYLLGLDEPQIKLDGGRQARRCW